MATAPDPFARPRGLERDHTWYPAPEAIKIANSQPRYMTTDDHLDRYILRCTQRSKKPASGEWLQWFLDDDAQSRERVRIAQLKDDPLDDLTGTPTTWSV